MLILSFSTDNAYARMDTSWMKIKQIANSARHRVRLAMISPNVALAHSDTNLALLNAFSVPIMNTCRVILVKTVVPIVLNARKVRISAPDVLRTRN